MIKTKGIWSVSDTGKAAFKKYPDPELFYREACKLYRVWKNAQSENQTSISAETEEVEESDNKIVSITYEESAELAWAEIHNHLRSMSPYEFQELVASLLRGIGYFVRWVSPPGKDGGIDILAWPDPLGTMSPRIKVQVKRYSTTPINVSDLRSFMALLDDDDVGLFVTTSAFTKDAHEEARTQSKRKITLIDAVRFVDLWIENYDKLDDAARRKLPLKPIYYLAPE